MANITVQIFVDIRQDKVKASVFSIMLKRRYINKEGTIGDWGKV